MKAVRCVFGVFFFTALLVAFSGSYSHALPSGTRERDINPNQELDTFVYVTGSTTQTWEIALPNGTYYVTLACGDAQWPVGPHFVRLSGDDGSSWSSVIPGNWDDATVANEYISIINEEIIVTAGKLSLELGGNDNTNMLNFIIISNSIDTPATTFPAYINCQPAAVPTPVGYSVDSGEVYDAGRGYGWDIALDSRDRDEESDQKLDTFVYTSDEAEWNLDVPIGTYYVTLSVGDSRWPTGPHRVKIEGTTVVDDKETVPQAFVTVQNYIVNVYDGQLTIEIGGGGGTTMLNYVDVFDDRADVTLNYPLRANFQPGGAELVANYSPDIGALYKDIYGYGWDVLLDCRERGVNSDQKYDTLIYQNGAPTANWEYTLPAGSPAQNYYLYMACGDAQYPIGPHYLTLEGNVLLDGTLYTAADEYIEFTNYPVYVGDGALSLTMAGSGYYGSVNYLIIDDEAQTPWGSTIDINFQPGWADPYLSYIIDAGEEYDIVRRYGWDIGLDSRDRDEAGAPDQRYDTVVYSPTGAAAPANWQIDVANGDYLVTVAFGDPTYDTGPYYVTLEGVTLYSGQSTTAGVSLVTTDQAITVSDGTIDLQMDAASGANHILYMNIAEN